MRSGSAHRLTGSFLIPCFKTYMQATIDCFVRLSKDTSRQRTDTHENSIQAALGFPRRAKIRARSGARGVARGKGGGRVRHCRRRRGGALVGPFLRGAVAAGLLVQYDRPPASAQGGGENGRVSWRERG